MPAIACGAGTRDDYEARLKEKTPDGRSEAADALATYMLHW